jgi:hypothetical protein
MTGPGLDVVEPPEPFSIHIGSTSVVNLCTLVCTSRTLNLAQVFSQRMLIRDSWKDVVNVSCQQEADRLLIVRGVNRGHAGP